MKKIIKYSTLTASLALPLLFAIPALAQVTGGQVQQGLSDINQAFPKGTSNPTTISELLRQLINWALYISAALSVIFIIIGGYNYITAGGNTEQAKKGRTSLVNALIGLVMIVLSYTIVQVVYNFLIGQR